MIVFKPNKTGNIIDDQTCETHCETFNKKLGNGHCPLHSDGNAIISVKVENSHPKFIVESTCCAKFKTDLEDKLRKLNVQ